jgi:hypothetical protein
MDTARARTGRPHRRPSSRRDGWRRA